VTAAPLTEPRSAAVDALAELVADGDVVVLSGAGLSTDSGIPDYRGASGSRRRHTPMTYQTFTRDPRGRHRYWARSYVGWRQIRGARPNDGHRAVGELQQAGMLGGVITQNVDGLHGAAGSREVVELHGALARVRCLDCAALTTRDAIQARLLAANPGWLERTRSAATAPDGDADLPDDLVDGFTVVGCAACGGTVMPDVVFFGGSVPRATLDAAWAMFDRAEALLVIGSSLTVFSGFRFVRRAAERGVPIGILNRGPTRGDDHAAVRLDARAGVALPALARAL
jgi:NAD-dependent SIR2 family protein deacetylase